MCNRKFLGMMIAAVIVCGSARSQQIKQGFEAMEILKIAEVYNNTPDLSFTVNYTYADSAYPANILEQLTGSYKIKDGKYWYLIDSIEYIHGNSYNVAVFHRDSTISVNDKADYGNILQVALLDSLFRAGNIDSMTLTQSNDSTRSLLVRFNPDSYYRKYQLDYDSRNYRIRKMEYHIKDFTDSVNTSGIGVITMDYSGYSEAVVDAQVFNEDKFIYRSGDYIIPRQAYNYFRLYVNVAGARVQEN